MKYSTRSIIKSGDSYAVTLPVDWLKNHNETSSINMMYESEGLILISAEGKLPLEVTQLDEKVMRKMTIKKLIKIMSEKK